jgi:hypothetical protein
MKTIGLAFGVVFFMLILMVSCAELCNRSHDRDTEKEHARSRAELMTPAQVAALEASKKEKELQMKRAIEAEKEYLRGFNGVDGSIGVTISEMNEKLVGRRITTTGRVRSVEKHRHDEQYDVTLSDVATDSHYAICIPKTRFIVESVSKNDIVLVQAKLTYAKAGMVAELKQCGMITFDMIDMLARE